MIVKKPLADVSEGEFDDIFAVNTKSVFFTMRAAARALRDGGRVINLGTTLLAATTANYGVYAGSKAPLEDFTRALALEAGNWGITVNTVAPGPIDTSFFHAQETPESVAYLSHATVTGQLGESIRSCPPSASSPRPKRSGSPLRPSSSTAVSWLADAHHQHNHLHCPRGGGRCRAALPRRHP